MDSDKVWRSMGTHGLVYSAKGSLVWSMDKEVEQTEEQNRSPTGWRRILQTIIREVRP